ncbi:MAG: diguanylate cyclase [Thermodesulfobacteriota bacterium]|nr:diguanylate cyclase [Thermodesulfobacteriota bacterium]
MHKKILLVDSDPESLLFHKHLMGAHFCVETACDPDQALQMIRKKGPFAVVVSELWTPRMDGVQFLSKVRQIRPKIVRIVLTGHATLEKVIQAVNECRIFGFLEKTSAPLKLIHVLKAALEHHQQISTRLTPRYDGNILSPEEIAFLGKAGGGGPVVRKDARRYGMESPVRGVTRQKLKELKKRQKASLDLMPNFPSRFLFERHLKKVLAQAKRAQVHVAILSINIDSLDDVEETHGTDMGRALLRKITERLQRRLRSSDSVARLGENEFTALLWNISSPGDVKKVAKDLLSSLRTPFALKDAPQCTVEASISADIQPHDSRETKPLSENSGPAVTD